MHASIAFCLMMVGGPIAPEPEIIDIPLFPNGSSPTALDDLEWKERTKHIKLPRMPTLAEDRSTTADDTRGRRYVPPTDPNAPQRRQPLMPMAPTDPGNLAGGSPTGRTTATPGTPIGQGYQGYEEQASAGNRPGGYTAPNFTNPVNGRWGGGVQTYAPPATRTPTASDSMNGIMSIANQTGLGAQANPMLSPGGQKPFNDYQRPSGYSPWMSLYTTPTNNGTMSTYTTSIQPQQQQQQYNHQVAEQIMGVRNQIVAPSSAMGGQQDQNMGGGLASPGAFLNYGGYLPPANR